MNSAKFVLRNSSLWWITGFWAEQEQSKITCGECPLGVPGREESASLEELLWGRGGRDVWYWAGWASACSQPLVVGKGKNTPIRLNWGAVGLFNPAHDSVSRGFDAENVAAPSRRMSGCVKTKFEWDRVSGDRKSGRSKSFSERVEGSVGNSLISETEFWKPQLSSAPKPFSVPVIFTELSGKRGCLWQQINTS